MELPSMLKVLLSFAAIGLTLLVFGTSAALKSNPSENLEGVVVTQAPPGTRCTRLTYGREEERAFAQRCTRFFTGGKTGEFLPNTPSKVGLSTSTSEVGAYANSPVKVKAISSDLEGDAPLYTYTTSGGRVEGDGPDVIWKLHAESPGTYTITVEVSDGCGCMSSSEAQVIVKEREPQDAEEHYNRATARAARKEYDGAIADYTKSIELNPENALA
jgi:tetratricopeptide (TPR) repeat protein